MGGSANIFIASTSSRACLREQRSGESRIFIIEPRACGYNSAMDERNPNPKRLVTWAIAGTFLASSTWLLSFVSIPLLSTKGCGVWDVLWSYSLRFVAYFAPFTIGFSICWLAERRFKRDFLDNVWSEAELEPVKTLVANPIWTRIGVILAAIAVLSLIFSLRTDHPRTLFYVLLLPAQTVQRIRQLVTPRVKSTGGLIDFRSFKPIHSDHWGQRPIHPAE